jgi:hypothetical protein
MSMSARGGFRPGGPVRSHSDRAPAASTPAQRPTKALGDR